MPFFSEFLRLVYVCLNPRTDHSSTGYMYMYQHLPPGPGELVFVYTHVSCCFPSNVLVSSPSSKDETNLRPVLILVEITLILPFYSDTC